MFLDRDGVINENEPGTYVHDWSAFRFVPGAVESIAALHRAGYPVIVITNQAGIGRGHMTAAALSDIHRRMMAAVEAHGGRIDAIFHCPHVPEAACECRKPQPGLLRRAARELDLDLHRSVFIGDNVTDVQASLAAGCRPLLVLTGHGRRSQVALAADPELRAVEVAEDLAAAALRILNRVESQQKHRHDTLGPDVQHH